MAKNTNHIIILLIVLAVIVALICGFFSAPWWVAYLINGSILLEVLYLLWDYEPWS